MDTLKSFLLHILILCCLFDLNAQPTSHISQITEDHGLSYRWVFDITQDQQGFLWFATYNGLNRYDGNSFVIYTHSDIDSNTISSSKVGHVTSDHEGNIWIYCQDLFFNKIDIRKNKIIKTNTYFKNNTRYSGAIPNMRYFASLQNGDFIVLFQDKDLSACSFWKYLPDKNAFNHIINIPTAAATIDYFSERKDGKIWLWGMGIGYYLIDLQKKQYEVIEVNSLGLKTDLKVAIPVDHHRDFWYPPFLTTDHDALKANELSSFRLPPNIDVHSINNIRMDNLSNIWFNYKADQLFHFDRESKTLEEFTDPIFGQSKDHRAMNRFFVDQEGTVWNGYFFGAYKFSQQPKLFNTYLNTAFPTNKIIDKSSARDIIEINADSILVKNIDHDLFLIDLNAQSVKPYVRTSRNTSEKAISKGIMSMLISHDGYLWANQRDKLIKTELSTGRSDTYTIARFEESKYDQEVNLPRIFEDASNNIWFCHPEGIYLFDKDNKKLLPIDLNSPLSYIKLDFTYASYDRNEDAIYGSYAGGIFILRCKEQSITLVEIFAPQETNYSPTAMLKWNNEFWLSTEKGLVRFNPVTKERKIYTRKDGLPSDVIYSALGHEQDLWLATHNGLCQFNPYKMQMTTFYKEEGLPHNEFNRWSYLKTKNGKLFFGGLNGIIGFDPNDFEIPNKTAGQLHLLEYTKYNQLKDTLIVIKKQFDSEDEIVLRAEERSITFSYTLNMFSDVNKNQYFHYLEGFEPKWIEDGNQNEIRYSKIPPGKYIFRVKARDPHKIPAVNELSIPVYVKQYWYLRWWALAGYFILLLLASIALYRFLLNRKLEKQEVHAIKELGQMKTKMYTNITHEFRTPLTVILGMNEVVKEKTQKGKTHEALHANELINRSGQNLLHLVNQMLELTKLESGLLEVNNIQEDIIPYLKYRLEAFQLFAKEKEVQITFKSTEEKLIMDFDAEKISQITNNLISNAIKFTPKNGRIDILAEKVVDASQVAYFKLNIIDSGIGIEKDKINHIFDRFYQIDDTQGERIKGTGIGLSLVKELVKLLNGTISVQSTIGQGSTFCVLLPIHNGAALASIRDEQAPVHNENNSVTTQTADDAGIDNEDAGKPLVLIVEDNPDVSYYINTCLEDQYKTVLAQNGREGIEKAIELVPDLIITDVMMPFKNGYELCSFVKKDERTSHIPIVILTSKADDESKIEGLEQGADVFLAKPFNRKELLVRLKNLLALRHELQKRYAQANFSEAITPAHTNVDPFLIKIKTTLLAHLEDENFSVIQLCQSLHISRAQLHRKIIALTGHSTTSLIRSIRMEKAKELLGLGNLNVTEVAYQVGFKTQAHFSRIFAETFGMAPSDYRKN